MLIYTTSMPLTVGYVRVSTDKQADSGLSLEAQEARIRGQAIASGWGLSEVIVDAVSAKSLRRPGVERLLRMIDAGEIDRVIIAKLDRITRSVVDLGDLLERFESRGVELVSIGELLQTKTAAGRLQLNILMCVSQWEREAISERTREALMAKRARGEKLGGQSPYGYSAENKRLVWNQAEQATVGRMSELRDLGWSLRDIADRLNEEGFRTRAGGLWRHQYVDRALVVANAA